MTALEWPEFRSLSRCNQGGIIVESRPFEERHKSPRPPRPGGWKQIIEFGLCSGCELRPQPGPYEERECQHQCAGAQIKARARADRRSAWIRRPLNLIRHRTSAVAGLLLPGVAEAAG